MLNAIVFNALGSTVRVCGLFSDHILLFFLPQAHIPPAFARVTWMFMRLVGKKRAWGWGLGLDWERAESPFACVSNEFISDQF